MPTYNDEIETYHRALFAQEDEVLSHIRSSILARGLPAITVRPEEGRFLQFLAAASGSQHALEIGTLGGYSGTWILRGLRPAGRLITLELEPDHAEVAREHFRYAGMEDRVEVRVGNAHDLLQGLVQDGPFDFVFIDAEKSGYIKYLEWSLENLDAGGLLVAHNAFRHGAIVDPENDEESTVTIREFNRRVAEDDRLVATLYPAGDGMTVAVKLPLPR